MRRIVSIDLETTGTRVATDRIVQVGVYLISEDRALVDCLVNPGCPIPTEAIDCHGITNEMVADKPSFGEIAGDVLFALSGCDLVGFNLIGFDIPLLWEEFYRAGVRWDLRDVNVVDVGNLFKKLNPRTLSAAVKHYCNRDHAEAHSAIADARATADVMGSMLAQHAELSGMDTVKLAEESKFDDRIDLAGMIVRGTDGRPTYNIGKAKGTAVADDPGFGRWMLGKDFPAQTRMVLQALLG